MKGISQDFTVFNTVVTSYCNSQHTNIRTPMPFECVDSVKENNEN